MKITQISSFIENRPGRLHAACAALAAQGVNIHALSLADTAQFGILRLIVADPIACKSALEGAGYVAKETEVVAVEIPDHAGGLAEILAKADEAELNNEYMYAFSTASGRSAVIVIRFTDTKRILRRHTRFPVQIHAVHKYAGNLDIGFRHPPF